MTRPRVPDDKRIRIAQACGFCKTRKQKCDGQRPCSLCVRKKNADNCSYDAPPRSRGAGPSAKRRLEDAAVVTPPALPQPSSPAKTDSPSGSSLDASTPLSVPTLTTAGTPVAGTGSTSGFSPDAYSVPPAPTVNPAPPTPTSSFHADPRSTRLASVAGSWREPLQDGPGSWRDVRVPSHLYATERMLGLSLPEGDTINLIGCSSHLAYLDALRNVLEVTFMPNPLMRPPDSRFRLMELHPSLSQPSVELPVGLPDERQTYLLVVEYLVNTHGLIQVFEEEESLDLTVRRIIEQGTRDPGDRVLLYLVLALGRVLSGPESEATVADIDAEAYFQSAEFIMADNGTKDLWTIRVLLLKCLYALSVVRRNEGYEYIGRAGWLAQLLGMHREEHLLMRYDDMMKNGRPWSYNPSTGRLRRNVWRSLLVLDRFVAAQLGRPTVVSNDNAFPAPPEDSDGDMTNLCPTIHGLSIMSSILTEIYGKPEASTLIAANIASRIPGWPSVVDACSPGDEALAASLPSPERRRRAMNSLLGDLLKLHCMNLLGRPFVLFDAHFKGSYELHPLVGGGEVFPRNAIEASYRAISLVADAIRDGYLPRRNPFIVNSIFSSALVVLSQEISSEAWKSCSDPILRGDGQAPAMRMALDYFIYSAEADAQAKHLLGLLRYLCSKCKNPTISALAEGPTEAAPSTSATPLNVSVPLAVSAAPGLGQQSPHPMQQQQAALPHPAHQPLQPQQAPVVYNMAFLTGI